MQTKIKVKNISRRFNSFHFAVELPVDGISQVMFHKDHASRAKALITGFLMRDGLSYQEALYEANSLLASVICQLNR